MPLFSRPDATLVPSVHPVRRIMPFLVPSRNGAFVLFEQEVAAEPARQALERLNAGRPPERAITLFHLVLRAIGLALAEFPRLNRFVAGSRLYQRRGIWLAFSAKQRLERDAPIFTKKISFDPGEPLAAMVDRILRRSLATTRSSSRRPGVSPACRPPARPPPPPAASPPRARPAAGHRAPRSRRAGAPRARASRRDSRPPSGFGSSAGRR